MEWGEKRSWSRFAVFVLIAIGLSFWLSRHAPTDLSLGVGVVVAIAAIVGVFVTVKSAAKRGSRSRTTRSPRTVPAWGALRS